MKKTGILNADLSYLVAGLGHKDLVMIGDAGMPIPEGVTIVDMALVPGIPTFKQTLDALLTEMEVEYFSICDGITLQPVKDWSDSDYVVGCITVYCGDVREIDNITYKNEC